MRHQAAPWRRIGWFVLLWVGGVAAIAGGAYLLRAVMSLALT
ncbi:MAG TPA: DUF2474 family protein [Vineibacter sp.]|nr:DUF2474 family protein [Vineibacter sp.]